MPLSAASGLGSKVRETIICFKVSSTWASQKAQSMVCWASEQVKWDFKSSSWNYRLQTLNSEDISWHVPCLLLFVELFKAGIGCWNRNRLKKPEPGIRRLKIKDEFTNLANTHTNTHKIHTYTTNIHGLNMWSFEVVLFFVFVLFCFFLIEYTKFFPRFKDFHVTLWIV
jgi:hypothetical protein